jgi:nicotinamide mononucleotide transporter
MTFSRLRANLNSANSKWPAIRDGVAGLFVFDWKLFEIAWLVLFGSTALALALFYGQGLFAFSVYLAGVICVVLAAKGHVLNYVVGLYNCFGYGYIAYANGLFGEAGLNFFFFVPMAFVGFALWRKKLKKSRVLMRGLSGRLIALLSVTIALCVLAGGYGLSLVEGQNAPYLDAATNVLSVAATFLMAWRYKEQWLTYIALDIITIVMWASRAIAGSQEGLLMTLMWSAYLVNAIYGYWLWAKGARQDSLDAQNAHKAAGLASES